MKKLAVVLALAVSGFVNSQSPNHLINGEWPDTIRITSKLLKKVDSVSVLVDVKQVEKEFIILLNKYRKSKHLDTLIYSENHYAAADFQCQYMMKTNDFSHENTTPSYKELLDRLSKFNIFCGTAGECAQKTAILIAVGYDQTVAEHLFWNWKRSSAHNEIMLSKDMKYVAISVIRSPYVTTFKDGTFKQSGILDACLVVSN